MTKQSNTSFFSSLTIVHYVLALLIIGGVVFAVFFFSRPVKMIYVDLSFYTPEWSRTPYPPDYTITNAVQEGDVAYDGLGNKIATVIEKRTIDWEGTRRLISMVVQVRAYYNTRTKQYSYSDNPLLIGNQLTLNIGNVAFNGKIVNMYTTPKERYSKYTRKNAVITLILRNRENFLAEALKTFKATNSRGELIAKTLNIQIMPAEMDVETDSGYIRKGISTIFKDIILDLALYGVLCAENSCYFNDTIDLKVGGENFYIQSENTYISNGKIINVSYKDIDDQQ